MGSRLQQERQRAETNLSPRCKSLGQYESHWAPEQRLKAEIPPLGAHVSKEHKQRGGKSNHGQIVSPGQNLNEIPVHHPRRRRSYSAS